MSLKRMSHFDDEPKQEPQSDRRGEEIKAIRAGTRICPTCIHVSSERGEYVCRRYPTPLPKTWAEWCGEHKLRKDPPTPDPLRQD